MRINNYIVMTDFIIYIAVIISLLYVRIIIIKIIYR